MWTQQQTKTNTDLIITQMFFDVHVFHQFVHDCRAIGINCPIVPGIMCINNYAGFAKMTKFCKTRVPHDLAQKMEALQSAHADAVKQFGIDFGAQLCRDILDQKYAVHPHNIPVLHFYTLNLEKVVYGVLEQLGWSSGCCLTDKANESDAATMAAVGSAWARVGDVVTTPYGIGTVVALNEKTGQASITLKAWTMAAGQNPTAILQKGQYQKQF
jgi:Methylenetetrahydrofolate reductase